MTLALRLWIYQSERFPLKKTVPMLAIFSAASICVSAGLAGRPLPGWQAFSAAFVVAFSVFFQMRACDEWKDAEDDLRYRPFRPVPRGLVHLSTILLLGATTVPVAALAAWLWHPPVLLLLALVWAWLMAMTLEFGVPDWLRARPVFYLASHMVIMPLITLALTGMEWMPAGDLPPGLWIFLGLSFVNGCVLEIGRKLWAPENEIEGVDSYSRLWSPRRAALIWLGCVALAGIILSVLGLLASRGAIFSLLAVAGLAVCAAAARAYARNPSPGAQERMDKVSGLWVLFCYATAGFLPLLAGSGG